MNAAVVVFVMMVYTHGGHWIPTQEFKTEAACIKAADVVKRAGDSRRLIGGAEKPFCERIEK